MRHRGHLLQVLLPMRRWLPTSYWSERFNLGKFLNSLNHSKACENCPNDFCSCLDYEENPDYISCVNQYSLIYWKCINDCGSNNNPCYADCNREYDANVENCPCKSGCPNGCPCLNYECPDTTPEVTTATSTTSTSTRTSTTTTTPMQSNSTVLVLNSFDGWQPA